MVRSTIERHVTRRALTAAGIGGILAVGVVGLTLSTGASPAAAVSGSTATGVVAKGTVNQSANSGSLAGAGVSASGISTVTRPGYAKASVASLTVGGQSIGSVSVTCEQGVSTVEHSGKDVETAFFHVKFGASGDSSATGVTVRVTDRTGKESQRVTAAIASCDKATTPPTSEPPTGTPTPPTGKPTSVPTSKPGHQPTKTTKPGTGKAPDKDAKPVTPKPGHHAVTG